MLIRVRACAVNHVDIDMRNGSSRLPIALPHTLGFEIAGDVAELGEGVDNVSVGDRVSPLYQLHCCECEWCLKGDQSSSLAKNTDADFKISFARRNSKFSRRNRRISSRSCVVS